MRLELEYVLAGVAVGDRVRLLGARYVRLDSRDDLAGKGLAQVAEPAPGVRRAVRAQRDEHDRSGRAPKLPCRWDCPVEAMLDTCRLY